MKKVPKYFIIDLGMSYPNIVGWFEDYNNAVKETINYCIDILSFDLDFFEEKNIKQIIQEIEKKFNICIREVGEEYKYYKKFDFSLIKNINNYLIIDNLLITNIGAYELSDEEIERFNGLIIFK